MEDSKGESVSRLFPQQVACSIIMACLSTTDILINRKYYTSLVSFVYFVKDFLSHLQHHQQLESQGGVFFTTSQSFREL